MILDKSGTNETIARLREREKEMKCLYKVHDIIRSNLPVDKFLMQIVKHIWGGWQYPMITRVKITFEGKVYREPGWDETKWMQSADIVVDDKLLGKIEVFYTESRKLITDSPFLPEEQKLLNTIAANISNYIFNKRLKESLKALENSEKEVPVRQEHVAELLALQSDVHWLWRQEMVQKIAEKLDMKKMGVKAFYLIGSVKNACCGPASDIDLLVHFDGDQRQRELLTTWMQGWSYALSEMNFNRTGYKTDGLIDLHIITDEDIQKKDSFASMIGAVTDRAKLIKERADD